MVGPRSGMTEVELPPGVCGDRIETLQARVAGNRWKFVAFTVAYVVAVAGSISAAVLLLVVLLPLVTRSPAIALVVLAGLPAIAKVTVAVSALLVGAWVATALVTSEKALLARLGAQIPRPGTLQVTRSALKDMSLAAGFEHSPPLYVIDTDRVNAFVLGRTPAKTVVGVTRGFADKLSRSDQRAVFANLMARVLSADTLWATAVSALAGPVWALRDADLSKPISAPSAAEEDPTVRAAKASAMARGLGPPLVGWWIMQTFVVVVTEVLAYWHQELAWRAAEKADAEGMLLLRDPHEMLVALERVLACNNHVPSAGDAYSQLFYCWSGFGFAPERDPEARRIARLREVLGAEGLAAAPRPNVPGWPQAPRLEDAVTETAALVVPVEVSVERGPDGTKVLAGVALAAAAVFDVALLAWRSGDVAAMALAGAASAVVAGAGSFWGARLVTAQGSGGRQGRATSAVAFALFLALTIGAGILVGPVWLAGTLAGVASGEELSREEWRRRFVRRYEETVAERPHAQAHEEGPEPPAPQARISVVCKRCGASNAPINRRCTVCGKKLKP